MFMNIFESAQPLMYHATFHRIRKFWPLSHFGSYRAALSRIVDVLDDIVDDATSVPDRPVLLYPVRLSCEHALRTRDMYNERPYIVGEVSGFILNKYKRELTADQMDMLKNLTNRVTTPRSSQELAQVLQDMGYDCLSYRNKVEDPGSLSYINLTSDQVHMWAAPLQIPARKLYALKKHRLGTWREIQQEHLAPNAFVSSFDYAPDVSYNHKVVNMNHNTLGI
jgi:hypothetical protein